VRIVNLPKFAEEMARWRLLHQLVVSRRWVRRLIRVVDGIPTVNRWPRVRMATFLAVAEAAQVD
jgi:hypothetical protein